MNKKSHNVGEASKPSDDELSNKALIDAMRSSPAVYLNKTSTYVMSPS